MPERSITEIGKYKILGLVGEGAMGVVYRATDSALNRTVAIKVMSDAIARQQDLRDRFLREAQAAGSMQHPNIVSIYDLGEMEGHLYIAMEFVEGVDLETIISRRDPLTLQAKLDIIIDVLAGLAYAHKRGIVHRDIKPANIRIAEDGRAKIMDFGVAHLSSSTMTRTGMVVGTPAYMAPEQVTGAKTSPATDLFAVGAVLYELLTGLKAFAAPTLQSLFFKIVSEPPVSIVSLLPGLPDELNRIIDRALEKNPADRYATALDMANALAEVRAKLSGVERPGTVSLTATVALAIAEKQRTTKRFRQIASAGGVLAVLAVAAIWFTNSRRNQALPPAVAPTEATAGSAAPAPAPNVSTAPSAGEAIPPAPPAPASNAADSTAVERSAPTSTKAGTDVRSAAIAPNRRPPVEKPQSKPKKVAPPPVPPAASRQTTRIEPSPTRTQSQAARDLPTAGRVAAANPLPPIPPPIAAPVPAPAPAPALPPAPPPAPPAPSAAQPPTGAAGVRAAVAEYAQAIEARDIDAVRRVYPGLTSAQQSGLERFFQASRRINVTFRVSSLDVNGNSAEARLVGTYNYVTVEGRSESQPVSVGATFRNNGSAWRLVSVH